MSEPKPCPRCLPMAWEGTIRIEALQPLPEGAMAPHAQDGSGPCCQHCGAADALTRGTILNFEQARVAVANDFQEKIRLPPKMRDVMGLGPRVRVSKEPDALAQHHRWLDSQVPGWNGHEE